MSMLFFGLILTLHIHMQNTKEEKAVMDSCIILVFEAQSVEFSGVETEDYSKWILLIVMLLGD